MFRVTVSVLIIIYLFSVSLDCNETLRVIIIGAGASGIAAATKLLENGISSVKILEAEQRIGGRIYSVPFGDAKVDLGAQWSHGEHNNIMYNLVKDLDLLAPSNYSNNIHYSSHNFNKSLAYELYKLCKGIHLKEKPKEDVSVGSYITQRFNELVAQTYGGEKTIKCALEILNTFHHDVLIQRGGFSWFDMSMLNNYDRLKGNAYLNWKGHGHGIILDVMMKSYPNPKDRLPVLETIHFNKEVTEIKWDEQKVASVRCADNSEYVADHVILTASLGVLKERYSTLFIPSLPNDKIEAIERLGIGSVVKVILQFPNKWWNDSDFQLASLCWDNVDLDQLIHEFPKGPVKGNRSWLENLCQFHIVDNNPNVLVAWFTGEFVSDIELLPEDVVIDGIMHVLHKFFGDSYNNITRSSGILRNAWYANPHFRGVYSFETVRSRQLKQSAAVILSKPMLSNSGNLRLLFAGEATSPTHYATVHGAIETGYREALRVVNLYK